MFQMLLIGKVGVFQNLSWIFFGKVEIFSNGTHFSIDIEDGHCLTFDFILKDPYSVKDELCLGNDLIHCRNEVTIIQMFGLMIIDFFFSFFLF